MKANAMPGFTADFAIGGRSAYRSVQRGGGNGEHTVVPQTMINGGGIGFGGGMTGVLNGFWCQAKCGAEAAVCFDAAIATENPWLFLLCSFIEKGCLDGCNSYSGRPA